MGRGSVRADGWKAGGKAEEIRFEKKLNSDLALDERVGHNHRRRWELLPQGRIVQKMCAKTKNDSKKRKVADYKATPPGWVLVGTYKKGQLEAWPGYYNYPVSDKDEWGEKEAARICELWLFSGAKVQRTFSAKFIGVKTREELIAEYGYPATGKAHGKRYWLFKTEEVPTHDYVVGSKVLVRVKDFAANPDLRKRIKKWLASDGRNGNEFADIIPEVVAAVPMEGLCVCETALQLSLFADDGYRVRPQRQIRLEPPQSEVCGPVAEYSRALRRRQAALFQPQKPETAQGDVRVLELFAGVGGFRVGLERASNRYKTVWNNQWEPATKRQDASIVYCQRFGEVGHSNEDIAAVSVEEIPEADLLVGGFPCQDYSVANTLKRAGGIVGKKGVLWWQIHRILRDSPKPPQYLFLENVDRLLKSPAAQRGRDFAIILASLADLGYAMEWRVINAADYGMPQRRRRTYMVAYREGTPLARDAAATVGKDAATWLSEKGVIAEAFEVQPAKGEQVREFCLEGDLAEITKDFNAGTGKSGTSPFENAGVMVGRRVWTMPVESAYEGDRMTLGQVLVDEAEVPEEFFIGEDDLKEWRYLKGPKSEERVTANGFKYHYTEGGMAFPDALDKPSRTIITGEGGTSPSRFKHVVVTPSGRYRRLTPLELERLNMFPDRHTEGVSDGRRAFLMGNALVTGIVERIGIALLGRMG